MTDPGAAHLLTNASAQQPLKPRDDDRSRIENCCIKRAKQPWDLSRPSQKTDRTIWVRVVSPLLMSPLATAYRLQCAREALGASRRVDSAGARPWAMPATG